MIKRLQNHLLEHYPLLWNMRLLSVLSVILALHIVHFMVGYNSFDDLDTFGWREPEARFFSTPFVMFSFIISTVVFILWLIRVFRNNAFKSFYPFSNGQLFAQMMIILLVCLLNITYYYSYTIGYVWHSRNQSNEEVNKKDVEIYNKVIPLLQESTDAYKIENRCWPKPFPLSRHYKSTGQNEVTYQNGRAVNTPAEFYYESRTGDIFTPEEIDSMVGGYQFSYLNQCNDYIYLNLAFVSPNYYDGPNPERKSEENRIAFVALLNNPKELKKAMQDFIEMCDRHQITYKLNADDWFQWVYNPPYYPVKYTIKQWYYSGTSMGSTGGNQFNPKGYYVELNKLQNKLSNTMRSYRYSFKLGVFCGFLYAALAMSLLVFAYRATSRRVWLVSFIGSGLICLIVGTLTAIIGINSHGNSFERTALYMYLFIIFGFLAVHFMSSNKTIAGACLTWFAWSLPFVSVIIFGFMEMQNKGRGYLIEHRSSDVYFFCCFLIYLLVMALVIVPRFRIWQASPED